MNYLDAIKKSVSLIMFVVIFLSVGCAKNKMQPETKEIAPSKDLVSAGLHTEPVQELDYKHIIYVDVNNESDGNGTKENPYQSLNAAINAAIIKESSEKTAIIVAKGEYLETTIQMQLGVDLYGGFNPINWERNIKKFRTILNAEGNHRVVQGSDNSKIDGFIISGGKVTGKGAAINCNGVSPTISNNVFMGNRTLSPQNWNPKYWHETANDGGAIYFENGSKSTIRNNLFISNSTENGRGAGIAANNKCDLIIKENVFISNIAGTNDPMRSSDGGAISIFDWCKAEITNNIFLSNHAKNRNDGGGVFIALWSSAIVKGNIFVDNKADDDAGGLFVGGQEHRYGAATLDPIPATKDFSVHISNNLFLGNKNSSLNSGSMRFTMESKGSYTNNITALNNGIYFQRSEVTVKENIILDNFLFIETKKGLLPGEISNNLIWANFKLEVEPSVLGNIIKGEKDVSGKLNSAPNFVDDGMFFSVIALNVNKKYNKTQVLVQGGEFEENSLINRVIRSGDKWGVVIGNTKNELSVWGNFIGYNSFEILPTYTLK